MHTPTADRPLVQKINQNLLVVVLTVIVLYFGRIFLIPLTFAILFAMLLVPICNYFDRKGLHRGISAFICTLTLFIFIGAIVAVIGAQIHSFSKDFPELKEKSNQLLEKVHNFTEENFNIPAERQKAFIKKQFGNLDKSIGWIITGFFSSVAGVVTGIVLILVYTFLLLYNKERYEAFFLRLYNDESDNHIKTLLRKITDVSRHYLKGRAILVLILSVLYSAGLLLIGIKHAILFGCIAALLTIIPYVGTLLGAVFPLIMALVTEPSWTAAIWVLVVMVAIQAIDNYFIEPYVIGSEVNLGALPTILSLIAGGLIWGVSGMILFIPLLGIGKIIFDNINTLKPLAYLIEDPEHKKSSRKTNKGDQGGGKEKSK